MPFLVKKNCVQIGGVHNYKRFKYGETNSPPVIKLPIVHNIIAIRKIINTPPTFPQATDAASVAAAAPAALAASVAAAAPAALAAPAAAPAATVTANDVSIFIGNADEFPGLDFVTTQQTFNAKNVPSEVRTPVFLLT